MPAGRDRGRDRPPPLLDVVIVSARGLRSHIRSCLESLERHPLTVGEAAIHVTDNGSGDGTATMIRERFPNVELEELDRNVGFPRGNNLWLNRTEAPFVLLLNPDTEVTAGALDKVVSLIRQDPEIGILGCRLVLRDGSFDHAAKRSFPTLIGAFGHFAGLADTASPRSRLGQYRAGQVSELGAGEVDAVNGAFMLVRREAIDQVGHLDERYPTPGLDDLDWCYRLKQSGWKVWYEGGVTVLHVKGSSTGETRGRHRYRTLRYNLAFHRALGRFYRKWYAGRYPFVDLSAYLALGGKFTISAIRSAIVRRSLR